MPDDLEATLWAESPMFYNPTNMDVDVRGRIWITEAVNYRNFNNDSTNHLYHEKGDRIMILEDSDQDGTADVSKVFIQDKDLVSPLGIAVMGNKILVSCSPHLIIYTDVNQDDVPDKKEIFLTGFGGLDHDHSLHAVVTGPDGNWYFNTGNAGPHVVQDKSGWTLRSGSIYTGGSPYNSINEGNMKSDDGKIWVGGLALRINPDGTGLKVMGHNFRNSYESIIDSYGNLWQNDNDDQVVACRVSWLMEGGNAGYFSTDGTRYWQADQRPWQDIFTAHWHQEDPGVMPAGDRSGAGAPTGITLNEGDELGEKYRGLLLSADAGRNTIFGYMPNQKGSGYDPGQRKNFISSLSTDNRLYVWNDTLQNTNSAMWFRPSDVMIGTDGAIYVADWYDPVVGGHQMNDSTGYGRIYRITPKGKNLKSPVLDFNTTEGLIDGLKNPAINVRGQAYGILKAKGTSVLNEVSALIKSNNPYHQARAIWLLAELGESGAQQAAKLLDDPNEITRATALRALRTHKKINTNLLEKLSADKSPFVRRETILALQEIPFKDAQPYLKSLLQSTPENDLWYLNGITAAWSDHKNEAYQTALLNFNTTKAEPEQWSDVMSSLAFNLHPEIAVKDLSMRVTSEKLSLMKRDQALTALAFINTPEALNAMLKISKSKNDSIAERARYWIGFRQSNDWNKITDWSKIKIDTEQERITAAMQVKKNKILDHELSYDEHYWNMKEMSESPVGGRMLLDLLIANKISNQLLAEAKKMILKNPDPMVRDAAAKHFKLPGTEKTYSVNEILKLKGDAAAGLRTFGLGCSNCHRIKNNGKDIGPELTLIKNKFDRKSLLEAIIHPSAAIVFGYEPWLVTLKNGTSYYGFLIGDGKETIVIKDISGNKNVIEKSAISLRTKQEKSIMPEPYTFDLTEKDLANLATYLLSIE